MDVLGDCDHPYAPPLAMDAEKGDRREQIMATIQRLGVYKPSNAYVYTMTNYLGVTVVIEDRGCALCWI